MRIALIGYEANIKNRVGSNQYAFELLKAIYELDHKNQYTVFLPTSPLSDLPAVRANWHYVICGPKKLWNLFGLPLALFKQSPKPDVVFNPGHYCPLVFPAPLVVSIMDLGYLRFPSQFTKSIYWKLKFWTALSIKRAKHLLTISQSTKNDIIKYYQIGSEKITVAYPGYDQEKFKTQVSKAKIDEVRKKYRIDSEYILFLSTLKPNKNIEGLLSGFEKLDKEKKQNQNLKLVVAGRKGWLFENIFTKVKSLGLEKKVIFTDFVAEQDLPALMSGAEVFVLPSFWEGFGIPVVESMAIGVPVVVSNAGSLSEITGEAGIIIDPYQPESIAEGIKKALVEKEKLIAKGFKQAQQFNWLECGQKVIKILERIKE